MTRRSPDIVLGGAVMAMGLLAGLIYAFDVAVMPALAAADDRTLVDAMQEMIDKIENPAFFLTFLGAPALAAVALVQARRSGSAQTAVEPAARTSRLQARILAGEAI